MTVERELEQLRHQCEFIRDQVHKLIRLELHYMERIRALEKAGEIREVGYGEFDP